jgi:hypothetical protein
MKRYKSGGIALPFLTLSPDGGEWSASYTVSVVDECTNYMKRRFNIHPTFQIKIVIAL